MNHLNLPHHFRHCFGKQNELKLIGRQSASLLLITAFLLPITVPARPLAISTSASEESSLLAAVFNYVPSAFGALLNYSPRLNSSLPGPDAVIKGMPVLRPSTKEERDAKVFRLEINSTSEVVLRKEQQLVLSAIPVDKNGYPVHGLSVQWSSDNSGVASVTNDGLVKGVGAGRTTLTARAGEKLESISVTVSNERWTFGGIKPDSVEALIKPRAGTTSMGLLQKSSKSTEAAALADERLLAHPLKPAPLMISPDHDPLPDAETGSLYEPKNDVGQPSGRTQVTAATVSSMAAGSAETPRSSNFQFAVPLISLPGRGLDVSLGLAYNSRLWNKSTTTVGTHTTSKLTFDVDSGWPAPGFRLGYGQLESQGSYGFTLTDPDGTRHEMLRTTASDPYNYDTTDGTFIHYYGGPAGGTLTMSDGTNVIYGAAGTNGIRSFPTRITDRNGNFIDVSYVGGVGPKILKVKDTLGRYISFSYSGDDLVEIKAPGYGSQTNTPDRTVARFYYETMDMSAGLFYPINFTAPDTIRVIRYIYFPGTKAGFRYDYSPYGMIRKITQLRKMQLDQSNELLNEPQWQEAASTLYDYPQYVVNLPDVPTFQVRTDSWAGQTAQQASQYWYSSTSNEGTEDLGDESTTETVTAPDGTTTEVVSYVNYAQPYDRIKVTQGGTVLSTVVRRWELVAGRDKRIRQTDITDEAGKTRSLVYSYGDYNNVLSIKECDFVPAGSPAGTVGTELRRKEISYYHQTHPAYVNRRLLRLPESMKVFEGGATSPISQVDYAYDGASLTPRAGIDMYSDPSAVERGNITTVTTYANAAASSGDTTNSMTYDVAGNVVEETVNCCQRKAFTYTSDYKYAYVVKVERGDAGQLTTEATYDFNTGLVRSTKDENNQVTTEDYEINQYPNWHKTTRPDGGYTTTQSYINLDYDDPAPLKHSAVYTETYLGVNASANNEPIFLRQWKYMDGRGTVVRTFTQTGASGDAEHKVATSIEYDSIGRLSRTSNPYYVSLGAASPGPAANDAVWTTVNEYDGLGRAKKVTLADGSIIQTIYAGTVTTVTDQAGRQRKQQTDALGRVIKVVEPGSNGSVDAADALSTTYEYDALGNITKITQGEQIRLFKYDSLGRLTHQKQVEAVATLNDDGAVVGAQTGKWTHVAKYDAKGLLTDAYDARGVHTQFAYNDGLNRLTSITYLKPDGAAEGTPAVTYTYDEAHIGYFNKGRLTKVSTTATGSSPQTIQAYDYDLMGRVAGQKQTVGSEPGYDLTYSYGFAGELLSETYPSGKQVKYSYDQALRLKSVTNGNDQPYSNTYKYAAHGGLKSESLGNSTVQSYSYNSLLQLEQIKLTKDDNVLQQYDYKYGVFNAATGNWEKNTGQITQVEGTIGTQKQWQQQFAYDSLGRLTEAKEKRGDTGLLTYQMVYTYDRYGNRYQSENQSSSLPYIPVKENDDIDKLTNRFKSVTGIEYDSAGNVTVDPKFQGKRFEYNANGRMRKVKSADGSVTQGESVYDGLGQRVQITEAGVTRRQVYDIFGQLVAEYGGEQVTGDAGGVKYVMADHQGSTRVVMNSTGGVINRRDYRPFGENISANVGMREGDPKYSATESTRQQYAATERDKSGLDHTDWRKYDSSAGRWTTPDPYIGGMAADDPQSFNRYSYVQNDPVNFVDPSGLTPNLFQMYGAGAGWGDVSGGFWGWGSLMNSPHGMIGGGETGSLADVNIGIAEMLQNDFQAFFEWSDEWHTWVPRYKGFQVSYFSFAFDYGSTLNLDWYIKKAYDGAIDRLLKNTNCRNYIRGNSAIDPVGVLRGLYEGDGITYGGDPPPSPDGSVKIAWTNTSPGGSGFKSTIEVYKTFFSSNLQNRLPYKAGGPRATNAFMARILVLLHELKHAMSGDSHEDGKPDTYTQEWNDKILRNCF